MKALRVFLYLMGTALVLAAALAGALWTWTGTATSLATGLGQLQRWLPAGQTLEAKEVAGSVRGGGSIGWLRWQQGELSIEVRDVTIAWSLRPLLGGELRLGQVHAKYLHVDDRRAPVEPGARVPFTDLGLPLKVDVPFSVDALEWTGSTSLKATGLAGHYVFDSTSHRLDGGQVRISSGNYQIKGSLQAHAPMALTVQVEGTVQATLPSTQKPLLVQAHATLTGALAGRDAVLALQAALAQPPQQQPQPSPTNPQAMQAHVSARIQPWQAQPVAEAQARWQALDLAALWPQAPQTRLAGAATVTPAGAGWLAGIQLSNTLSGPWNQQRLPLESLVAKVTYAKSQWSIESLQGTGAGGRIEAQGQISAKTNAKPSVTGTPAPAQWHGSARAYRINPAALDSRLGDAVLDGQLTAQQAPSGIAFEASLQPAKGKAAANKAGTTAAQRTPDGLRLKTVHAQGLWEAPLLKLGALAVQTDDAQLQGQLTLHTINQAIEGQLTLVVPGAESTLAGHLASTRGEGDVRLSVTDAAQASRWIARLPGAPLTLGQMSVQGNAEFTGHWQGGWKNQGQALQMQARLRVPKLDLRAGGQPVPQAWQLRDWQANASGTLRALSMTTRGQAETGTQRFNLQAQAHGGRLGAGAWQALLDTAQLTTQDRLKPGTWTLQLNDPVTVDWKQPGTTHTLETSAGSARLSGPVAGSALVSWQPARWSRQTVSGRLAARTEWRTQGRVADLPLAWLDLLGQTRMANLGLRGDVLFSGAWDAAIAETLRLRATLERTSGDLLLQTEAGASTLRAGVRDARLVVTAEGDQLAASLRWDSERAGQAQADFNTRLQRQDGSWNWPADAAVRGTVKAQLPPVGIWSLLAPPGWRLRGSLDADAVLSGTRSAPQWLGNLVAQDLAVRSVVDGLDFSQGSLRATLEGQRLDIQDFTLHGAGGASGGLLRVKGSVVWLPPTGVDAATSTSVLARVRMELDATAEALRVSARADRNLVVSGALTARLSDTQLAIRGTLKADQALFILPEDTAPRLGDDVVVRAPVGPQGPAAAPKVTAATSATKGPRVIPDVLITLDLGPSFQVRGNGLVTRLAGSLELRSAGTDLTPRLTGELATVGGTYRAYGQQLSIEQGVLRFAGPYNNPSLDILAIRPNLQQRVGVEIRGTARSPVARLYAEPDLPDAEKLSWLILGRAAGSGGAETALLQQAALALLRGNGKPLSGSLGDAVGLDELSVRGGVTSADASTVLLGKRLSRDFYVAYERSLAGILGTLYIFFDLSRRVTVRAQTGEQSAIDLIFTLPYD
jgi:translocation and assembly module TamB